MITPQLISGIGVYVYSRSTFVRSVEAVVPLSPAKTRW